MRSITVPHQFFIDERKKLYNWKPDFWRELLQNSVDAGSSRIDVSFTDCGGGQIQVDVSDDGCGMTRDVLERVYFALGETTKTGGGSIGGFGRARIMTCFGHDRYEIETLTNHVRGVGGEYMIDDIDYQNGCIVRVWMSDTSVEDMKGHLTNYLRSCSFDRFGVMVRIDNNIFSNYLDRGRRVRELSFAGIYVNRSGPYMNSVIFRVGGLTMFSRYVNCKKQVVVEISPDMAREVLSSNRNSFVEKARIEVDRWIDELVIDDKSALRNRNREVRQIVKGSGSFVMNSSRKNQEPNQRVGKSGSTSSIEVKGQFEYSKSAALYQVEKAEREDVYREPMPGSKFVNDIFDVLIINETYDSSMDKVVERYHPQNWTYEIKNENGNQALYRRGREAYRLLIAWKIAVEEALRILVEEFDTGPLSWTVGWVFGDYSGCHVEMNGNHVFCLNPVDGTKSKYGLSNRDDLLVLLSIAKHEAAHARVDIHNETWGYTLTRIDGKYDTQAVLRRIKAELSRLGV